MPSHRPHREILHACPQSVLEPAMGVFGGNYPGPIWNPFPERPSKRSPRCLWQGLLEFWAEHLRVQFRASLCRPVVVSVGHRQGHRDNTPVAFAQMDQPLTSGEITLSHHSEIHVQWMCGLPWIILKTFLPKLCGDRLKVWGGSSGCAASASI